MRRKWGRLKDLGYNEAIADEAELLERLQNAIAGIQSREVYEATRSVLRRCQICLNVQGKKFEDRIKLRKK